MSLRLRLQRGFHKFSQRLLANLDSKKRLWIVQVDEGGLKNQSFIVDEDSFQQPLDWMLKRHYSVIDLENVDKMKCAEMVSVQLENAKHCLIRAK
ncbi:hypothetical protein FR932_04480 [Moritella marina ATCC 15381]|uniref:Uncharacterized protein n=1 Tax=Moritella marina ATCC 15381 TaxID=1202962 RepID=A0A5J6WGN7_MORMI|nr:hypothetical protein [Moritella marina]QFI37137.1 hypothetical protein FR932_04480 [Moritella marina ATCC 15381]